MYHYLRQIFTKPIFKLRMFVKHEPHLALVLFVSITLAIFFRTYNYLNRIYFYADSTLFVQAAYYAKSNLLIPQIGPFAQAPFFTGPWWLWIIETLFFLPLGILTPWYVMTLTSLAFIVLIYAV